MTEHSIPADLRLMYGSQHTSTQSALLIERIARLEAEVAQLKAQVAANQEAVEQQIVNHYRDIIAALSKPVSIEEWAQFASPFKSITGANRIIAARLAAAQKEHAALNDQP